MFGPLMFITPIHGSQIYKSVLSYVSYQWIRMVLAFGKKNLVAR
jgi:hypothetical protein